MSEEPTKPDEETAPEGDEDVPEPVPADVPEEQPPAPDTADEPAPVNEIEPKLDFQQFVSMKDLRPAPVAALRRWLTTQGQAVSTARTQQEWEGVYSDAMAHS